MSGQLIGNRYRVLRKIGEGGMAVVHLAVDEKLGRDVAIKILRERYEHHDEIRTRFQHEARAISSFDHPNILKVYDFSGENSRQLWIVTELIHGRNLAQILETTPSGWLHPIIAASIVREICRALASAHEHGVVHRDVKPENVMITHHGTVKLMDFGIAKIQRITNMTQTGIFMGSPSYMSPEQVRGRDVDNRSDIYSLGVLFYELVTGKLPFTGSSTADIAMRILNGDFAHPRFIMAGIPESIDQCIVHCMSLQPENRPQTIEYVGEKIDSTLKSFGLDSSMQELERCFKDPKSYGDRLARLLKITEAAQEATVLIQTGDANPIAKYNSEAVKSPIPRPDIIVHSATATAQRRDHLLPPRSVPHFTKRQLSPEHIAAHLPERRHQQRVLEATRLATGSKFGQYPAKNQNNHRSAVAIQKESRPQQEHINASSKMRSHQRSNPREVRPVSRIVPAAPRRNIRQIRYVANETYHPNSGNGNFTKFVIAVLLISSAVMIWLNNAKTQRQNTAANVTSQKTKKVLSKPNTKKPVNVTENPVISAPVTQQPTAPQEIAKKQVATQNEPLPKFARKNLEEAKNKANAKPVDSEHQNFGSALKTPNKLPHNNPNLELAQKNSAETKNSTMAPIKNTTANTLTRLPAKQPSQELSNQKSDAKKIDLVLAKKSTETEDSSTPAIPQTTTKTPQKINEQIKEVRRVQISVASTPAAELFLNGRRHGTTNNNGTTSDWIEIEPGSHRMELRRSGFVTKKEIINVTGEMRQRFGPFMMSRGDSTTPAPSIYKLTLSTNLPPVEVSILNIESNERQIMTITQPSKTIPLEKGVYEVTMSRKGDVRKRRLDFSGNTQQLTFSVEFKETSN